MDQLWMLHPRRSSVSGSSSSLLSPATPSPGGTTGERASARIRWVLRETSWPGPLFSWRDDNEALRGIDDCEGRPIDRRCGNALHDRGRRQQVRVIPASAPHPNTADGDRLDISIRSLSD